MFSTFIPHNWAEIQELWAFQVLSLCIFKTKQESSSCLYMSLPSTNINHLEKRNYFFSFIRSQLKFPSADPKALCLKWQIQEHSLTWWTRDKKNSERQLSSSSHFPRLLKHLSEFKYPVFWVLQAGKKKSPFLLNRYKAIYSNISAAGSVHKTLKIRFV